MQFFLGEYSMNYLVQAEQYTAELLQIEIGGIQDRTFEVIA